MCHNAATTPATTLSGSTMRAHVPQGGHCPALPRRSQRRLKATRGSTRPSRGRVGVGSPAGPWCSSAVPRCAGAPGQSLGVLVLPGTPRRSVRQPPSQSGQGSRPRLPSEGDRGTGAHGGQRIKNPELPVQRLPQLLRSHLPDN